MNEIILKMPRRKNNVRIVKSKEELRDFIQKQKLSAIEFEKKQELQRLKKEELKLREKQLENEKNNSENNIRIINTPDDDSKIIEPDKPHIVFTEKFSISGDSKPLEIAMDNITDDMLSIDEAMIEVQEAYDRGFNDGKEAANTAYQSEINKYSEWIRRIDTVVDEMQDRFSMELSRFSEAVVKTSILTAQKILENEISTNSKIIVSQVKKAIRMLDDNDVIIRITVNPEDYKILVESKSDLVSDNERVRRTKITTDSEIDPGSCVLTTSAGELDGKISSQLNKIQMLLQKSIDESSTTIK